jgi:hypothetical protein
VDDVINSLPMFPTLAESLKIVALSFKKDIAGLSCCVLKWKKSFNLMDKSPAQYSVTGSKRLTK